MKIVKREEGGPFFLSEYEGEEKLGGWEEQNRNKGRVLEVLKQWETFGEQRIVLFFVVVF